jgi:hypothetical protein
VASSELVLAERKFPSGLRSIVFSDTLRLCPSDGDIEDVRSAMRRFLSSGNSFKNIPSSAVMPYRGKSVRLGSGYNRTAPCATWFAEVCCSCFIARERFSYRRQGGVHITGPKATGVPKQ